MAGLAVYHVVSIELTDKVNSSGNSPIRTEKRTVTRAIRGFRQKLHVSKATVKTIEHNAAPVHAMTSHKTRDVQLHSFFTSALGEGANFAPPAALPPGANDHKSCWAPEPVSNVLKRNKKILTPTSDSKPGPPSALPCRYPITPPWTHMGSVVVKVTPTTCRL